MQSLSLSAAAEISAFSELLEWLCTVWGIYGHTAKAKTGPESLLTSSPSLREELLLDIADQGNGACWCLIFYPSGSLRCLHAYS